MKYGLFLDDERVVSDVSWMTYPEGVEWDVVRTRAAFFYALSKKNYTYVSFDHDIQEFHGGRETTGYDVLKGLVDMLFVAEQPLPTCFFHTQNPVGKKNMECYYLNAKKHWER